MYSLAKLASKHCANKTGHRHVIPIPHNFRPSSTQRPQLVFASALFLLASEPRISGSAISARYSDSVVQIIPMAKPQSSRAAYSHWTETEAAMQIHPVIIGRPAKQSDILRPTVSGDGMKMLSVDYFRHPGNPRETAHPDCTLIIQFFFFYVHGIQLWLSEVD